MEYNGSSTVSKFKKNNYSETQFYWEFQVMLSFLMHLSPLGLLVQNKLILRRKHRVFPHILVLWGEILRSRQLRLDVLKRTVMWQNKKVNDGGGD